VVGADEGGHIVHHTVDGDPEILARVVLHDLIPPHQPQLTLQLACLLQRRHERRLVLFVVVGHR